MVFAGVRGLRSPCWRQQRPRRVGGSLVEVGGDVRGLEEVCRLVDDAGELGKQLEEMGDGHMEWYGGGISWAVQRPGGDCHKRDDKTRVVVLADRSSGSL